MTTDSPGYSHTQHAPLWLILCCAPACLALALIFGYTPDIFFVGIGILGGLDAEDNRLRYRIANRPRGPG